MNIAQNTKLMYKFIHICKFEIFENKSYFKKKKIAISILKMCHFMDRLYLSGREYFSN